MSPDQLVVAGGTVLLPDGDALVGASVVVRDGRIASISRDAPTGAPTRAGARVVDAAGAFVLPGLVDAHFHLVSRSAAVADEDLVAASMLEGVLNARERLRGGVTTVRDAGCRHRGVFSLRRAIEVGLLEGPRCYLAGRNPTGPSAPVHWRNVVVTSPTEARAAVDAQLDAGADWVKCVLAHAEDPADWGTVTTYMDEPMLRAAVERAHERGVRVGVHCEGYEVARMAVACGVDVLDHAPLLDEETLAAMHERDVVYVPTLWAFSADAGIDLERLHPDRRRAIEGWRALHRASVAMAAAAGVTIAAGSDAVGTLVPSDVLVRELEALSACGLSPSAVLAAATVGGAAAIGDPGLDARLAPGSVADLLVVDADPRSAGWEVLAAPRLVVAGGKPVAGPGAGLPASRSSDDLAEAARSFSGSTDRWATEPVAP